MTTPTIRPAGLHEAALAADIMTASFPREPQDPELTARRWKHPKAGWTYGRFIVEVAGEPAGYLELEHGAWSQLPERHCWLDVYLDREHMDERLLNDLWRWIEDAAAAEGSLTLMAACGEDEPEMIRVIESRGYERERTERVWSLDLRKHGGRIVADAAASRARMETAGITLTTLDRWDDRDKLRKLHELNELTRPDIPSTGPVLPQTFEDFLVRVESPGTPQGRWWMALRGQDVVAMSYLSYPPVRGSVWTSFTCCHPEHRGRGIARAV